MATSAVSPPRRGRPALVRAVVGWLIALICLAFLGRELLQQFDRVQATGYQPGWRSALSIPVVALGQVLAGSITWLGLRRFGAAPRWPAVLRVHLLAQMAKYLPLGGMWNVGAQGAGLSGLPGVGLGRSLMAIATTIGVLCSSAVSWYGLELWLDPGKSRWLAPLAGAALPAFLLAWWWPGAWRLAAQGVARFRGAGAAEVVAGRTGPLTPAVLLALGAAAWLVFGFSLILVASEMVVITPVVAGRLLGVMALGWLVGFVAVVTPAGLGVRDVTIMLLLRPFLDEPWPAVIPAVSRCVWLLGDVLNFVLATTLFRLLLRKRTRAQ